MGRNTWLIASGVVILILFAFSGYLLIGGLSKLGGEEQKLDAAIGRLRDFHKQEPFPSAENVEKEQNNVRLLKGWYSDLGQQMRRGQVESTEKRPTEFMRRLEDVAGKSGTLRLQSTQSVATAVAETFLFGFDRYQAEPPAPDHVPRLIEQLTIIERLCQIIFQEKIEQFIGVERDEFEGVEGSRRMGEEVVTQRRAAGLIGEGDIFGKYRFVFKIKAKERALVNVLNRFVSDEMFTAVTRVEIDKEGSDLAVAPPPGEGLAGQKRRDRLACGDRLERDLTATIEVAVYKSRKD